MRASTIGMLLLGFVIGIVGCAKPTTPSQPSAEGETPAATEVLKPVIEEPAAETAEPATEATEPAAETPEPAAETPEPAAETAEPAAKTAEPESETAEPAKETPATDDES